MNQSANTRLAAFALIVSGSAGTVIGLLMLLNPVEFHAMAGIALGSDKNLLNEMRAAGGGVLGCGLFVTTGAFRAELTFASTALATMIYLANGLARLFGMMIDGPPGDVLLLVAAAEIGTGLGCGYVLSKFWR